MCNFAVDTNKHLKQTIMAKKVYRRLYRARCGDAFCFSTRIKDIYAFLNKILINDGVRTLAQIEFEVVVVLGNYGEKS